MHKAKRIFGVGRVILDHVVVLPAFPECDTKCLVSEHWQQVGGPVPVALSTAAHFGIQTTFLGPWGNDAAGREISTSLSERGIDIACCRPMGVTGFAQIWTEERTGKRTVAAYPGAEISDRDLSQYDSAIDSCQILHLDGSSAAVAIYAARRMRGQGGIVVLDAGSKKPEMENLLPLVNLLVASDQFCRTWFGRVDVPLDEIRELAVPPRFARMVQAARPTSTARPSCIRRRSKLNPSTQMALEISFVEGT